ncbi:probable glutathione S-transferase BZ2 [Oryza sativa Japonica Group]|uniref:Glutathione S-transferase n=3 Tax=Oryza TaxID=4527 RepID=A0A0P0XTV9_ORYSJ|nr:probable glutathione S-transferase BZ2 [Oryza sativa Japonica Group]AAM22725.1 putative Bronze-2 protein [Oryza sativa Japonica Group]AAM44882.1 Putative Bronze-2 protein [Oryza sativa Japonica Group]AAP53597.1 Glutathione S-transferase, N-terminal domain containing protein, expressed [Oryza sativa Japonica Group]BAF26442.1 Os10g0395400 [Oryza sativa Japonica Group]BAT10700.1 Os10g0395400 [Oryza sativa Japonica Group]|eukprot:NP_001064528.1 Os10g0395400 [Oryza sativa Japonica Group]
MAAAAEEGEGVRLLGGRMSPFTMRARMALALRGVEYELVEEALHPRKSGRLLAANPAYGRIPVLLLPGGRAVCESAVIAQYVDDAWGGAGAGAAILPVDPYERAMHRFWTAYIDDKFWPALDAISLAPTPEARATATASTRAALKLLEEAFAARSNGGAFFSGGGAAASPGLLDVALGCFLPALWACENLNGLRLLDDDATPLLRAWSARLAATPAAMAVMPETEEVVAFTRFLQTKFGVAGSK